MHQMLPGTACCCVLALSLRGSALEPSFHISLRPLGPLGDLHPGWGSAAQLVSEVCWGLETETMPISPTSSCSLHLWTCLNVTLETSPSLFFRELCRKPGVWASEPGAWRVGASPSHPPSVHRLLYVFFLFPPLYPASSQFYGLSCRFSSVQFSCSVMSNSLGPHGLQHTRPPCLLPAPGDYSNSCLLSWWYRPIISSFVVPFSSCLQSFPASGSRSHHCSLL